MSQSKTIPPKKDRPRATLARGFLFTPLLFTAKIANIHNRLALYRSPLPRKELAMSFKAGDSARVLEAYSGPLQTAWVRITAHHGFGPWKVEGTHPKGDNGQLVCLRVGDKPMVVDATILKPAS